MPFGIGVARADLRGTVSTMIKFLASLPAAMSFADPY